MRAANARYLLVAGLVWAGIACGERQPAANWSVRDSAGIEIVESRGPAWAEGAGWAVAATPLLAIGLAEGAAEYQFSQVEGALRLPDGRIVVADGGSREIRFFDAEGGFLFSSGRRGGAPGEYRQIIGMGSGPGDSIWVFDYGVRRFTVLSADGEVARTLTLDPTLSNVGAVGRLDDGSFVVRELWSSGASQGEIRLGLGRDPAAVARYAADGTQLDTIGLFPGREVYIGTEDGRGVMSTPLFAHSTSAAVTSDAVYVGDQERFEIGRYSATGALQRSIRLLGVDLRTTRQDIERATEERLASVLDDQRAMMRAQLESMEVPATRPAYGRLLVDAASNLWVSGYAAYPSQPVMWHVFAADGRLLGRVRMPQRFRVFQVGAAWILGVWRDDYDVEYVHVYELRKDG